MVQLTAHLAQAAARHILRRDPDGVYGMNSMLTCLAVTLNLATNLTASQFSMAYNSQLNISRGATR